MMNGKGEMEWGWKGKNILGICLTKIRNGTTQSDGALSMNRSDTLQMTVQGQATSRINIPSIVHSLPIFPKRWIQG